MKRKSFLCILVAFAFCLFLTGCVGTLQEEYHKLTPDERARLVLDQIQTDLECTFDDAKAFVHSLNNMDKLLTWRDKILPAFNVANKELKRVQTLMKEDPSLWTPDKVRLEVQGFINDVLNLLTEIGYIKTSETECKPLRAAMPLASILILINYLLNMAFGLWSYANKIRGKEPIPSWEEITDKNYRLDQKIKLEKEELAGL